MPLDFHRRLLQNPRMAYDEKAAGIVREIEQALEGGWTNTAHAEALRLSGGILNAIELQVEEDGPPTSTDVLRLLGDALLAQIRHANVDPAPVSACLKRLARHVEAR